MTCQVETSQVRICQVRSGQVRTGEVKFLQIINVLRLVEIILWSSSHWSGRRTGQGSTYQLPIEAVSARNRQDLRLSAK